MARRVRVFAHAAGEKVAKGVLDFYNEDVFQKFRAEGGSVIIRYEGGDIGIVHKVETNTESVDSD